MISFLFLIINFRHLNHFLFPSGRHFIPFSSRPIITNNIPIETIMGWGHKVKLDQFLHDFNIGHWEWNLTNNYVEYSNAWCAHLGRKADELEKSLSTFEALLHPKDKEETMSKVNQFIRREIDSFASIFRLEHANGKYVEIFSTGNFLDDERTIMRGIHIPTSNIYQGLAANEFYELSISKIISNCKTGFFVADLNGHIKYANSNALPFFDIKLNNPDELCNKNLNDFFSESDIFATTAKLFLKTKLLREYSIIGADGIKRFFEVDFTIERVFEENMIVGLVRDITHRKANQDHENLLNQENAIRNLENEITRLKNIIESKYDIDKDILDSVQKINKELSSFKV